MEPKITFTQVEPHLHKWGRYLSSLYNNVFEEWELINAAWADGRVRFLPQSRLKFASARIRWDMIHYIREETKSRHQMRWNRSGRHWPKFFHISALDGSETEGYSEGRSFIETYAAPGEDSEQKDLISHLVNHPSLSGREKLLMNLYYVEGYTDRETGRVLGYTESRCCLLRNNVLERLRAQDLSKIA